MINHAQRLKGIGGSELAAILGLDPYRTPLDVWAEKTGRKPPFEGNEATERGNILEGAVGVYMQRNLGDDWVQIECPSFVHSDHPVIRGNPDRIFKDEKTGEKIIGELKTTIEHVSIEDLADPENPKKLPWLFQAQYYMGLTGIKKAQIGWLGAFFKYKEVEVEFNEALWLEIVKFVCDWWERHIVGDIAPEPINASDAGYLWPKDNGEWFEASDLLAETIDEYTKAKQAARDWEKKAQALADRIKLAFGKSSVATVGGLRVASYKADRNGLRVLRT